MDNHMRNSGDKKKRFQNEISDITLDPPGNRIDKELLQFLNNLGSSSGSKPMILLFPPGLGPVVTKAIKYHAKKLNLTVLYLRHGNELIVGVCRKHFVKEELRDEVSYEEEDTEPFRIKYVVVEVNPKVDHQIEKNTTKLMNLPTYGLKLDDQLKPLKEKVTEFAETDMVRKSDGFLGLPPPDREPCALSECVALHTPSTINLTSEFQYLDQAQVVEPSVFSIEPENPFWTETDKPVELHITGVEMMSLPTKFSYPAEMTQNVPDTTSIEVAASSKRKRRKGRKKKSKKNARKSVQLEKHNVQPIITNKSCHYTQPYSYDGEQRNNPTVTIGATGESQVILEDAHSMKDTSITKREADEIELITPAKEKVMITKNIQSKQGSLMAKMKSYKPDYITQAEEYGEVIESDHFMEETSTMKMKSGEPEQRVLAGEVQSAAVGYEANMEDVPHTKEETSITEIEVDNPERVVRNEQIEIITENVHHMKEEKSITEIDVDNSEKVMPTEQIEIITEDVHHAMEEMLITKIEVDNPEKVVPTEQIEIITEDVHPLPLTLTLNTLTNKSPYIQQIKRYVGDEFTLVFPKENFLPYRSPLFKMEHIIELYDFPTSFDTATILKRFKRKPRYIKWCDDNHALLVTKSPESAKLVLGSRYNDIKLRPMSQASPIATMVACRSILVTKKKSYTSPKYESIAIEDSATCLEKDSEITATAYPVVFEDLGAGGGSMTSTNFDAEREDISHTEQGQGDV